jgi:hypothetical protein
MLAAIGLKLQAAELLSPIRDKMQIEQKTIKRQPLDQFFTVALHSLRLAFPCSMAHKFTLDALYPISAPHAEFLQDGAITREYCLTAPYSEAFIIKLKQRDAKIITNEAKGYLEKVEASLLVAPRRRNYAEAQTWK